jgi:hypothetical protein
MMYSHNSGYKELCLLRHNVSKEHIVSIIRVEAAPATNFMLVSCLAYTSTLKMNVTCSSETTTVMNFYFKLVDRKKWFMATL